MIYPLIDRISRAESSLKKKKIRACALGASSYCRNKSYLVCIHKHNRWYKILSHSSNAGLIHSTICSCRACAFGASSSVLFRLAGWLIFSAPPGALSTENKKLARTHCTNLDIKALTRDIKALILLGRYFTSSPSSYMLLARALWIPAVTRAC
jgi:hypothetical protein